MAGDRNVTIRLRGDIGDFQAKMVAARHSVGAVTEKMTGAEKESVKFRRGLTEVGDAAGKIGLVAAAGIGAVIGVAANFEQAMSDVQAATHETADNMEALREAAIQAGADTAFSAGEAAAAIENLAKAGVSTGEILDGGLQGALDLAAAGTMDVAEAAETAAVAMAQFGLDGAEVPHIADLLAAAAGKAQGEVSDMAMALKQGGLVADQVGLSIEETTGALAAFAEKGLIGSDSGTSFKTMLQSLTPSTEKAASAMESLGISAFDSQGNFIGLAEWAGRLQLGLRDMSDEQRNATLKTVFGSDAVRAATVIYEQGERGIRDWIGAVDDQGFAAETAAIKLDNLKGDLEALQGSLETLFINMGDSSQGPLRSVVQNSTDAVNALGKVPESAQNAAMGLGAITAVTGGALWFGSKIIQGVANTREALDNLGDSGRRTGRILKTALVTTAVLEGLNLLDQSIDAVMDNDIETSNLGRSLKALASGDVTGEIENAFGADLEGFSDAMVRLTSNWAALARVTRKVPLAGGFIAGPVDDDIENIEKIDQALAGLVESGERGEAAKIFSQLTDAAGEAGYSVGQVQEQFEQYMIALRNADGLKTAGQAIVAPLEAMIDLFPATGDAARDGAEGLDGFTGATEDAERAVLELDDAMSALFDGLDLSAATDAWRSSIKGFADDLKGGNGALDRNTEAGQKNRETIRGQIEELRSFAEAQYEATGNVDQLRDTLLRGRKAIIDQAVAAGVNEDAMKRYMRQLGFTREEIRSVTRQMRGAEDAAADLGNELDRLDGRDVRIKITQTFDTVGGLRQMPGLQEYATGGYTGVGGKYQPAGIVHKGEFVFDAQTTAMFRPFFEELHRTRRMPGYADGGFVRQITAPSVSHTYQGQQIDYDRLATAMQQSRPIYGDVNLSPHNYNEFKRQMEEDRHRASLEGRR